RSSSLIATTGSSRSSTSDELNGVERWDDLRCGGRPSYWQPRTSLERPRNRGTPEQRDELAPPHSITSSARASNVGGISRPSALAVLRLITSSYLVGACTGRSAGFSPFRMRSRQAPACRYWSLKLG